MACSTYNTPFLTACLNGDPGIARIYIADYNNILTSTIAADGATLSGLTTSGTTAQKCFYKLELLQDVGASVDTPTVSVANGVALSMPSIKLKLAQMDVNKIIAFNQLKNSRTVVVYENVDGVLFIVGLKRGLFFSSGTAGTDEATFEGITVELKGKEKVGQYILSDALQTSFVTTYVN